MSGYRLAAPMGTHIDRRHQFEFSFNGRALAGFAGDTLASALLANGVRLVGRSVKRHRPRGILSCGVEEPTGILDVGEGARRTPNTRATDIALAPGMVARSTNCWPSVRFDLAALSDRFRALTPAGFYYKTFLWPRWEFFETFVRRAAGFSHGPAQADPDRYDAMHADCDVLVIGAGPCGRAAARAAAEGGADVMLVASGALTDRAGLEAVRVLPQGFAFGVYDHLLIAVVQALGPGSPSRERLWKIRARSVLLATGASERPMVFPDNDRPGVMLAGAVERYAERFGVACGRRALVVAASDHAYAIAAGLARRGLQIAAIVEARASGPMPQSEAVGEVLRGAFVESLSGGHSVRGARVRMGDGSRRDFAVDLVCSAAGRVPDLALFTQAGGTLRWHALGAMFVPAQSPPGVAALGACAGAFDAVSALAHARDAGAAAARGRPDLAALAPAPQGADVASLADTRAPFMRGSNRAFLDLQGDVTAADVDLAARENYRSVEHLKRYTTAGMGTDQGRTGNVNAIAQLAAVLGREPGAVGTTRLRPPAKPVTLGVIAQGRGGPRLRPLLRLRGHEWHAARGAAFDEYGGWLRPAAYPQAGESLGQAAQREARAVRSGVGIFDGSPLGKFVVHGPDAAQFLDRIHVGTMSTLAPGRARYGALLNENGIVIDDGIVARLGPELFWVNSSSAGAARYALHCEDWLQRELAALRACVTAVGSQWANLTIAGPLSARLLAAAGFPEQVLPACLQHMAIRDALWQDLPIRVLRASYSGELGFEINVPAASFTRLAAHVFEAGREMGVTPFGIEALQILRIEKGYVHVGSDTDGATFPGDIGLDAGVAQKRADFVGRRSLLRPVAVDPQRQQLVGLVPLDRRSSIPVGAHIAEAAPPARSLGFVTSACHSVELGHPVALARLAAGRSRTGAQVRLFHMGNWIDAQVCALPFVDAAGARLRGS